jgi:hypothetical protein
MRAGLVVAALALIVAAPAAAQTGYPVPTATCAVSTTNLGTHNVGDTFAGGGCGPFAPGTLVTFTLNGVAAGSKTAGSDGSVPLVITILSVNQISVDDIVPGVCGTNTVTLNGTAPGGGALSRAVTFFLNCVNGVPVVNPLATSPIFNPTAYANGLLPPGLLPPTAAAPANQQQQQQQQSVSTGGTSAAPAASGTAAAPAAAGAAPAATPTGRLSFTGANVLRWSVAALVLIVAGLGLLVHSRRRRARLGFE